MKGFIETIDKMKVIHKAKNHDYAEKEDPYKNFRMCENMGLCSVETGIMVRMSDKMSRIANLLEKENAVKDESIADTLMDLSIYAIILKCYIEQNRRQIT